MNKWQMSNAAPLKGWGNGGNAQDNAGVTQYSIHRFGRSEEYRRKNRKRRSQHHSS